MKTKLLIFLVVVALFGVIVLYVLEFQWFQNTFEVKRLVVGALLAGVAVGMLLGFIYQRRGSELVEKMQIWATCIVIPVLLMPLLASLSNRLFAGQPTPTKMQFWEEKAYVLSRFGQLKGEKVDTTGFFAFVIKDGEMVRLEHESPMFPTAQQGDTIEVAVRRGLFGVEFVEFD